MDDKTIDNIVDNIMNNIDIDEIFKDINKSLLEEVNDEKDAGSDKQDSELLHEFIDEFMTEEQSNRDGKITELLSKFVENYSNKVTQNKNFKEELFDFCKWLVGAFAVAICVIIFITTASGNMNTGQIVAMISASASLIAVPIGIFKIVVSYIFPKEEEKYITEIVKLIQKNDLENKKTNIDASFRKK